jgi:hypothetical protein
LKWLILFFQLLRGASFGSVQTSLLSPSTFLPKETKLKNLKQGKRVRAELGFSVALKGPIRQGYRYLLE